MTADSALICSALPTTDSPVMVPMPLQILDRRLRVAGLGRGGGFRGRDQANILNALTRVYTEPN